MIIISGRVIKGEGYGKKIGFPTANLDRRQYARLKEKPRLGIYAGTASIGDGGKIYKAGIVIGPIDKTGRPKVEAHLMDFKGNLYGKRLQLELIKYLRPFANYRGEQQLKKQISSDMKKVKTLIKIKQ